MLMYRGNQVPLCPGKERLFTLSPPRRWQQRVSPKRWCLSAELDGVTSLETVPVAHSVTRTSEVT